MAGDLSPDIEWVEHTLATLAAAGRRYDCLQHPAADQPVPPRRDDPARVGRVFTGEAGVDSLRAVEKVTQHPGKMWVIRGGGLLPLLPLQSRRSGRGTASRTRRCREVYVQNASLEIAWTRVVTDTGTIAGSADRAVPDGGARGLRHQQPAGLGLGRGAGP